MAEATLSRGSTSVTLPLIETGGSPVCSVDFGKPNLEIQNSGLLSPRHIDQWSGLEQYTLLGRFTDSSAYSDAITLMDLIKSHSGGTPLLLNINMPEFDTDIEVAPAAGQEEAVSIAYNPGRRNHVEVDLGLTRVDSTVGDGTQNASTPTASGTGPIQLSYAGTTIDLSKDVVVERAVGRPNSTVRRAPSTHPRYIDKRKAAYDAFELSLQFTESTVSKVTQLADMFNEQLGRRPMELSFNGLYGMGTFDVVPQGSGALRHSRVSGEQGTAMIPTISLRRVFSNL